MLNLEGFAQVVAHGRRRGWHALVALAVLGSASCDDGGEPTGPPIGPPTPGSILVTTATSGFLKGESYELIVDGVSQGTIGANDEVTVSGLDPASYDVELGDVADNCTVEGATVPVVSEEVAGVSLTVACAYADPVAYTIDFRRERPDLDTGEVTVCPFGICSTQEDWDLYVYNDSQTDPQSVIRQNQSTGVEIAHLPEVALEELAEADFEAATFTTELVGDPFDSGRVLLVRTDLGSVYALGNPVEDTVAGTLTFDAALIAEP